VFLFASGKSAIESASLPAVIGSVYLQGNAGDQRRKEREFLPIPLIGRFHTAEAQLGAPLAHILYRARKREAASQ